MTVNIFGISFKVHFLFTAVVSILLCIDRSGVVMYSLAAVAIHEAGHLGIMFLTGQKPQQINLCPCGVLICADSSAVGNWVRFAVAAGGPAANIIPALFLDASAFKTAMLVNGLFNLLPASGLDGSDMIGCVLDSLVPYTQLSRIKRFLNLSVIVALSSLGALMLIEFSNPTLVISAVYVAMIYLSTRTE